MAKETRKSLVKYDEFGYTYDICNISNIKSFGDVMVSTGIWKIGIAIRRGDFVKKPTLKKKRQ